MINTINRNDETLERKLDLGLRGNFPVKLLVSERAIERAGKDRRIGQNLKKYWDYVGRIANAPGEYPQEIIGEFRISPRRHNPLRIAWGYDSQAQTIHIYDFLYHTSDKDYVDKWNRKAANGTITKDSYREDGFVRAA